MKFVIALACMSETLLSLRGDVLFMTVCVVTMQAQQAEETSTTIQKLRRKVQAGEGSELELERAEGLLFNLTSSLNYLQTEMNVALKGARRAFRQGFGEDSESEVCLLRVNGTSSYIAVASGSTFTGLA
jgi:hypothetical protein